MWDSELIMLVGWEVREVNGGLVWQSEPDMDLTGQVIKKSFWVLEHSSSLTFSCLHEDVIIGA